MPELVGKWFTKTFETVPDDPASSAAPAPSAAGIAASIPMTASSNVLPSTAGSAQATASQFVLMTPRGGT